MNPRSRSLSSLATGAACTALLVISSLTATAQVTVPGTSDLWLAGMPDGSIAGIDDVAPGQSPVLVSGITALHSYSFSVTGSVNNTPDPGITGPDGGSFYSRSPGAENGISDVVAPLNSLMGVFLSSAQPDTLPAPATLDFSSITLDFSNLTPAINQAFFIGDGRTSGNLLQTFVAPVGATRLYLGTMDGYGWANNWGSFEVTIRDVTGGNTAVPEPSTYGLLGAGALGGLAFLRRRRAKRA